MYMFHQARRRVLERIRTSLKITQRKSKQNKVAKHRSKQTQTQTKKVMMMKEGNQGNKAAKKQTNKLQASL